MEGKRTLPRTPPKSSTPEKLSKSIPPSNLQEEKDIPLMSDEVTEIIVTKIVELVPPEKMNITHNSENKDGNERMVTT